MKIKCNAKVNLCLAVTGKRADGYHIIDSVMQSISLYDTLTLEKADGIKVVCSKSEFSGEKNIAYKAAKAFFDYTGISSQLLIFSGTSISLSKKAKRQTPFKRIYSFWYIIRTAFYSIFTRLFWVFVYSHSIHPLHKAFY